jgi:hypothetical protein
MLFVSIASLAMLSGCITGQPEMAAKSGTDQMAAHQNPRCTTYQNNRSECDDQVGCGWDYSAGTCATK